MPRRRRGDEIFEVGYAVEKVFVTVPQLEPFESEGFGAPSLRDGLELYQQTGEFGFADREVLAGAGSKGRSPGPRFSNCTAIWTRETPANNPRQRAPPILITRRRDHELAR